MARGREPVICQANQARRPAGPAPVALSRGLQGYPSRNIPREAYPKGAKGTGVRDILQPPSSSAGTPLEHIFVKILLNDYLTVGSDINFVFG